MAVCPGWAYGPNFFLYKMSFMSRLDVEIFGFENAKFATKTSTLD